MNQQAAQECSEKVNCTVAAVYDSMTAGISLILGKTGAHRAQLQLLELSFSATC